MAYLILSLKIVFLLAIVLFDVGSLIHGVAPTSVALTVIRAFAGSDLAWTQRMYCLNTFRLT